MRMLLIILATLAASTWAAEPQPNPPPPTAVEIVQPVGEILVRDYAQLRITGASVEQLRRSQLTWFPRVGVDLTQAVDWDGQPFLLFRSRVAGDFLVFLAMPPTDSAKGRVAKAEAVLHVAGDPQPDPKPDPKPDPQPTPGGKIFAVLVEETSQRATLTPAQIAALISPKVADYMRSKGHGWRVVDKDIVAPDGKPPMDIADFLTRAKARKLPTLIVASESGQILVECDLPADESALLAELQKWGGK